MDAVVIKSSVARAGGPRKYPIIGGGTGQAGRRRRSRAREARLLAG